MGRHTDNKFPTHILLFPYTYTFFPSSDNNDKQIRMK